MEGDVEDFELLDEIRQKKGKKSFQSVINNPKSTKIDLDDYMAEA